MAIAIGMVEFSSIARGIYAADQMVKISEVEIVTAQTICPGKYIALVEGDVAAVQDSVHIGEKFAGEYFISSFGDPQCASRHFPPAITGATMPEHVTALGIFETFSVATMITAADQILKAAGWKRSRFVWALAWAASPSSPSPVTWLPWKPVWKPAAG